MKKECLQGDNTFAVFFFISFFFFKIISETMFKIVNTKKEGKKRLTVSSFQTQKTAKEDRRKEKVKDRVIRRQEWEQETSS